MMEPGCGVALSIPSAGVLAAFPGIEACWNSRPKRLQVEQALAVAAAETYTAQLHSPNHPAVASTGPDGERPHGLFARVAIKRGDLIGWYGGELVMASELTSESQARLFGEYTACFKVDEDLDPQSAPPPGSRRRTIQIDASRLRCRMAFVNDWRWDAMHSRLDLPPPPSQMQMQQWLMKWMAPHEAPPTARVLPPALCEDPLTSWVLGPNAEFKQVAMRLCDCLWPDSEDRAAAAAWWPLMSVVASADIAAGEEILLDYGGGYWRSRRFIHSSSSCIPAQPAAAAAWLEQGVSDSSGGDGCGGASEVRCVDGGSVRTSDTGSDVGGEVSDGLPGEEAASAEHHSEHSQTQGTPRSGAASPPPPAVLPRPRSEGKTKAEAEAEAEAECTRWARWRGARSASRCGRTAVGRSKVRSGVGLISVAGVKEGAVLLAERPLCALPHRNSGREVSERAFPDTPV